MNPEDPPLESSTAYDESNYSKQQPNHNAQDTSEGRPPPEVIRIADIQRMNIDQLNLYGKALD